MSGGPVRVRYTFRLRRIASVWGTDEALDAAHSWLATHPKVDESTTDEADAEGDDNSDAEKSD